MRALLRARQREPASRRVRALGARDGALPRRARAHRALRRRARRRLPDLHARHDRVAQPRRDGVGTRERRSAATRSSSRRSSITRTSSPGSSSRSRVGAQLRICPLTADGRVDLDALASLMSAEARRSSRSATSRTRSGTINPVPRSRAIARARRRADRVRRRAGRAAPAASTSTRSASTSTRSAATRCCGPMGIGGLVGRRALLEAMPPYQIGGDMIEFVRRRSTPRGTCCRTSSRRARRTSPTRSGSPRRATISTRIGMDDVRAHERALIGARDASGCRRSPACASTARRPSERSGVVSFTRRRHPSARSGDDSRRATACAFAPDITARSR